MRLLQRRTSSSPLFGFFRSLAIQIGLLSRRGSRQNCYLRLIAVLLAVPFARTLRYRIVKHLSRGSSVRRNYP